MKRLLIPFVMTLVACTEAPQSSAEKAIDPSLCQFSEGACIVSSVELTLAPQHAPSEQPLTLQLTLPEGDRVVSARIEGRDMFMGVIPVQFDENGHAEVIYGSCSSNYMVWRMLVTVEDSHGEQYTRIFDWLADAS